MNVILRDKKKYITYLTLCIIILYMISSFYFIFKTDEEVSMGLIQHNFSTIMSVDSLDVHPPFYYLFLRFFLLITTFWTKSFFIKVIAARTFSFILLLLFIYFMMKLIKCMGIKINTKCQIIMFLISPGVINESAKIRMYSLSAFLLAFELYQLMLFVRRHKLINFFLLTISASLASYTFYPLAISSGLFILLFFLLELLNKHKRDSLLLAFSGICIILLYIPWINIAINQFKTHSTSDGSLVNNYFYIIMNTITQLNASSPTSPLLKYMCIISMFVVILFISLITYSINHLPALFNRMLLITVVDFIITLIISLIICKRQFRLTILYPIYSIFIFLLIVILIKNFNSLVLNKLFKCLIIFTGIIFIMYSTAACINNIKTYDIPSIRLVKNFSHWKSIKTRNININKYALVKLSKGKIQGNATYATQDAEYLSSLHKGAVVYSSNTKKYKEFISNLSNNENNYKLFHKLFPNLRCKLN